MLIYTKVKTATSHLYDLKAVFHKFMTQARLSVSNFIY